MNKRNKTQKGISLIALIITVVVLLVLAVATVLSVNEENIIIKRAQESLLISDYQLVKTDIELYKMNDAIDNMGKKFANEDLIGVIAKKIIVKDTARELAVLVDFNPINSKPAYGKGGIKLLEEDNDKSTIKEVETLYDLEDVYVIDLEDGVLYYIDGEIIYTLETEKIQIKENGITLEKYPIETNGVKHVNEESFITKWNVTLGETEESETYRTVVLPVKSSSTYDATIHWGDGSSTSVQWKKKSGTLTEEELKLLTGMVTHTYTLKENDNAVRTISIEGIYPDFRMNSSTSTPTKSKLRQIEQWGNIGLININFKDCTNLGGIVPKPNRDDSFEKCTSFGSCFQNTGIQSLEEGFLIPDTIGGEYGISNMFNGCKNLENVPNSFQIPSKVKSTCALFSRMF